jgi:hypothetical protein
MGTPAIVQLLADSNTLLLPFADDTQALISEQRRAAGALIASLGGVRRAGAQWLVTSLSGNYYVTPQGIPADPIPYVCECGTPGCQHIYAVQLSETLRERVRRAQERGELQALLAQTLALLEVATDPLTQDVLCALFTAIYQVQESAGDTMFQAA